MKRHAVTAVTLTVLVTLLVIAGSWGWRALFSPVRDPEPAAAPPPSVCGQAGKDGTLRLRAKNVTVSVFNAGTRPGLASSTRSKLAARGFQPGEAANAPPDISIRFVQVWSTRRNDPAARLVAKQFGPDTLVKFTDDDLGPGIDVIVGNDFRGFRKKVIKSVKVTEPGDTCQR